MKPKIREIREKLQLSQREWGESVGITKMAVSHIENGYRNLSVALAFRIINFLKSKNIFVTMDDLYQGLKCSYTDKGRFSAAYELYEPDATRQGWLIKDKEYIFAIGNISDDEIAELAGKKFVNVIKCKDFEVENWNI